MDHFDYCIVGAGVIGLATTHRILQRQPNARVVVLEQHDIVGSETSSRNSFICRKLETGKASKYHDHCHPY